MKIIILLNYLKFTVIRSVESQELFNDDLQILFVFVGFKKLHVTEFFKATK